MREHLYKAKRSDTGEWVEGSLITPSSDSHNCEIHTWKEVAPCVMEREIISVFDETVCQYTGLTDKNGAKIFEGDVLTAKEYPYQDQGKRNYDAIVSWVFNGWQLVLNLAYGSKKRGISDGINQGEIEDLDGFEIIGNIHDKT